MILHNAYFLVASFTSNTNILNDPVRLKFTNIDWLGIRVMHAHVVADTDMLFTNHSAHC